jgi:hypothetical protein
MLARAINAGGERRARRRLSLLHGRSVGYGAPERARTHPTDTRTRKSPARFPGRAQFVSFNFKNKLIRMVESMVGAASSRLCSPDGALA